MNAAQMRALALSMPGAEEKSHFGQPDFRVQNKIFAGLSIDGKRGTLKLTPEIQLVVVNTDPAAFSPCPGAWGRSGWTFVALSQVKRAQMEHLVREAWSLTAPKRLVASVDGKGGSKPSPRRSRPRKEQER